MSKIINGVASEYEMPMIYESKTMTNRLGNEEIFTRWQDPTIEQLQQEIEQLKDVIDKIENFITENKKKVYHNPFIDDDCGIEIYLDRLEIEELESIIIKAKEGVYNGRKSN